MTRTIRTALILTVVTAPSSACAVRLGGPSPEEYDVVAISELLDADAAAVAQRIRSAGAEIVLIAAERPDTAWFAYLASQAGLALSGPGSTTGRGFAFMTNLEILGDTTLVLPVQSGGAIHMHDALYRIDEHRNIDLMIVRMVDAELRDGVRTLLNYIATDVPADAPLLLALDGPTPEFADNAATLMRATIGTAAACRDDADTSATPAMRLLYGPSARIRCLSARTIPGELPGIVARLEVGRW